MRSPATFETARSSPPPRPRRASRVRPNAGSATSTRYSPPIPMRASRPPWPRLARVRSRVCRCCSRTTCARPTTPPRVARASSRVGALPMTPPWCGVCGRRARWWWARGTWTSSRWAPPPSSARTARRAIPTISRACRAARRVDRPRPWRTDSCRWRWEVTPAARCASRRRSAACTGSSPRTAGCRATGSSRSAPRSTRWACSRATWATWPRCTAPSRAPTRSTRARAWAPRRTCATGPTACAACASAGPRTCGARAWTER